jgi:hypothetical protein
MSERHRMGNPPGRTTEILNLVFIAAIGWLAMSAEPAEIPAATPSILGERELKSCQMDQDGYVRGAVFGKVQRDLAWQGTSMLCDGMPRPDGGFRLMFSESSAQPEQGLRIVVGIVGAAPGSSSSELTANVTVIDQDRGLFFSTQGLERCWVKLSEQIPLSAPDNSWRIGGKLYCLGALSSVDGSSSITLGDIDFSGKVTAYEEYE